MCGIVGHIGFQDAEMLRSMLKSIGYQWDSEEVFLDGPIALARMCVPKFPFSSVIGLSRTFQTTLLASQSTPPSIDEAKPEAQAASQTNLGTGMRARTMV
jgi:hypothetical protein